MKATHKTPLRIPLEAVDLEEWIYSLSDADYRAASPQHRAAGVTTVDGVRGTVNVESIGVALIIQHYKEVSAVPRRFELLSGRSRAYVFHILPVPAEVRWTMTAAPGKDGMSELRCEVELNLPPLLSLLSRSIAMPLFIRRHVRNETLGFARDMETKYANLRSDHAVSQTDAGATYLVRSSK